MKKSYLFILLTLMLSAPTFAQVCRPTNRYTTTFNKFMQNLVTENRYDGNGTLVELSTGSEPTVATEPGHFTFERLGDGSYVVRLAICPADGDGQCESDEQSWTMIKGCLYVTHEARDSLVRILRSTVSELWFEYTREDEEYVARYELLPRRRLRVLRSRTDPASSEVYSFLGRGI